jgi:hypothetical protein
LFIHGCVPRGVRWHHDNGQVRRPAGDKAERSYCDLHAIVIRRQRRRGFGLRCLPAREPGSWGVVENGMKLAYVVPPGDHTFMVVSEAADFMKATLLPGKTYYALITPRMGAWKARFSFRPLRQPDLAGADFADWDKNTHWVETGAEAVAWADRNAADVAQKRARYWAEWSSKDIDQRNSQTLFAVDGR